MPAAAGSTVPAGAALMAHHTQMNPAWGNADDGSATDLRDLEEILHSGDELELIVVGGVHEHFSGTDW